MRLPHFILFMVAGLVLARAASASAVYAWVPEDPESCCRGVLELSDAAFLAGEAIWTPGHPLDANPVERFHFEGRFKTGALHPTAAQEQEVELVVTFAATPETARCCAWDFQLRVAGDGLTGRLRVTTQNDDIILAGSDAGWQIAHAGSDAISYGVICGDTAPAPCLRDRGRWVLVSAPRGVQKTGHRPGNASPYQVSP